MPPDVINILVVSNFLILVRDPCLHTTWHCPWKTVEIRRVKEERSPGWCQDAWTIAPPNRFSITMILDLPCLPECVSVFGNVSSWCMNIWKKRKKTINTSLISTKAPSEEEIPLLPSSSTARPLMFRTIRDATLPSRQHVMGYDPRLGSITIFAHEADYG